MSIRTVKRPVVAALLFLVTAVAVAKCASVRYTLSGTVKDCKTGQALPAAQIVCFADDETTAWSPDVDGPAALSADSTGSYRALYYLNTYSGPGLIFADRCSRRLKRLTVVVSLPGYVPARVVLGRAQLPKLGDDLKTIQVPPVLLVPERLSCCPS